MIFSSHTLRRLAGLMVGLGGFALAGLQAVPRINEVVFNGTEAVEIFNPDGGAVVLTGYKLQNQDTLDYTFPTFTLGAGSYVVVNIGTGVDTATNLYVGAVTEQLDNAGDDLVLRDDLDAAIDYIAWGSGGNVDSSPAGPLFSGGNISITGAGSGDSVAFHTDGVSADSAAQWIVRSGGNVTLGAANTQQAAPAITYTTASVSASVGEAFTVDLGLTYSDEAALGSATVTLQVPAGIFVASTDGGTYNGTQISWSLGAITSGTTLSPQFRAECDTAAATFAGSDLAVSYTRYSGGASSVVNAGGDSVVGAFLAPVVSVSIADFATGDSVIYTEDGQFVELKVTVANAGPGDLVAGTDLVMALGNNLTLITIKNGTAGGTSVTFTQAGQNVSFTSPTLASGASHEYFVRAQVDDCTQLTTTVSSSWGFSDLSPGAGTCSEDTDDTVEIYCLLEMEMVNTLPSGTYASAGEVVTVTLTITNNNDVAITDGALTLTLPADYFFSSVSPGTVANYTTGTRTVLLPAGVLGTIPAGGTKVVTLDLIPSCEAISDQDVLASLNYGGGAETLLANSDDIPVRLPQFNILFEDAANPGSTTILAERGETVVFLLSGINSGQGELNDGADMSLMLGDGYSDVVIRMGAPSPGGTAVTATQVGNTFTWNTGAIAATTTNLYYITATVDSCDDLDNSADYSWGVVGPVAGEDCTDTNVSSSSVTIELAAPELTITYPALPIDYCNGGSITIPMQNTGTGQARNVTLVLTGIPDGEFLISNPSNVSITHVGDVVTLTLTGGSDTDLDTTTDDIAPGATVNVGFDIIVKTGGVACGAGGGSIEYQPGFEDSCDYIYTTGTAFGGFSVTNQPSMGVSITGNSSANVGETGLIYTVTATYSGPAGTSVNFDLVADYPDAADTVSGFGNFIATAASDGGSFDGNEATWTGLTLTTPAAPAFSTVTLTRTITLDAPTITCAGGNSYNVDVALAGTATDCNGCSLIPGGGLNGSAGLFINNNNDFVTAAISSNDRTVSYLNINSNGRDLSATIDDEGETCTPLTFAQTLMFNSGNGVMSWSDPYGTGIPITFTDDANDGLALIIPGSGSAYKTRLNLSVSYNGADRTSLIADSDIVETGDGTFQLDLSGLDGAPAGNLPNDGHELIITYTLESDGGSSGGVSFGQLFIKNNDADPCGNDQPEEFDQGVNVAISGAQLNVGVTKITGSTQIIDKCETATFRLSLSSSNGWSVYDGQVSVELGDDYAYGIGTTVIAGLTDENGAAIATVEPTIVGTTLTWDFGDLNDANGTIEFEATKLCGTTDTTLAATALSNTNCNNQADASVTTRSESDTGSYTANTLAEGNMAVVLAPETFFAKDAYPVIRFYVVNSGNGKLYNAVVPVVLADDLEFLSAEVVGGGAVVPTITGQTAEFTFDEVGQGDIVTVEMTLRFNDCDDLNVSIVNARWGCEGDFCQSGLGDTSVIEQAESKIFVVSHSATPETLDYCNGTAIFSVIVRNSGVVEAYEPVIREFLPDGLTLLGTPQYRVNGGGWLNFPGTFTSNNKAAMGDPSSGPTGGTWYYWNFTDPNNDGSEADALLSTTDGHESDGDGRRHVVLKPGGEIELQFEVQIADCTDALAYSNSSKTARAAIFFDLPCDQASTAFPAASSSLNSILRPPGRSALDVQILAENTTKGTASTNTLVRGELGDTIEVTLSIEAIGVGQSPNVTMNLPLPSNLSYESITVAGGSTGGVSFTGLSTPTVGNTGTISFTVDNSNGDAYGTSYLRPDDKLVVTIIGEVLDCDSDTTVAATAGFGCCDGAALGSPVVPGASGEVIAAFDLQSRPDVPTVTILETAAFDACTGELTITLMNPNADFTLYDFDTILTLPSGWVYDDSTAGTTMNGVTVTYSGAGARVTDQLTAAEEEPYTGVATELRWASTALANGQIAPARAKIFPSETVEIVVFLRNDNCPDNTTNSSTTDFPDRYDNDTNNPDINLSNVTASVVFEYQSSCQSGALDPVDDLVTINPDQPDLDILSITPSISFIDGATSTITWTMQVRNTSSEAAAANTLMDLVFGAGYTTVSLQTGTAATASTALTFDWDDEFTLAANTTTTWTFQATIDTGTRGDLSVTSNLDGRCYNLNGDLLCNYSDDYLKTFVTGAAITKVTDGTELVFPAVSTAPGANNAEATEADLTIGSIVRNVLAIEVYEGGSSTLVITDVLPIGFSFLEANGRIGAGAWSPLTNSGSGVNVELAGDPLLTITGGASVLGSTALFVEIWSQVDDDTTNNVIGNTKTNTAELEVTRGSFVVSHDDPSGVDLQDTNTFTLIEPRLTSPTKVSDPVTGTAGTPNVIDLSVAPDNLIDYTVTVENTGTSPAYETIFTDAIPFGMDVTAAVIEIDRGGSVDTLTDAVDYTFAFVAGVGGDPGLMTLEFADTTLAQVLVDDVVTITYTGAITGAAPAQQLYNAATFSGYSSLPGDGATLTTADGSTLNELDEERTGYGTTFLPPTPVITYHILFAELDATKLVSNEITLPDGGGVAADYRDDTDDTTRVTIGERVIYQVRLAVPPFLTIYEPRIEDAVPDGLTVRELAWEVVDPGDPLTDGATIITTNIAIPAESSGTTPVAHDNESTGGANVALPATITGGATGQELLLQIEASLDQALNGGGAINAQTIVNTTTFRWASFTGGDRDYDVTTEAVEFTAVVPAIANASVTKELNAHQDSGSTPVAPVTATATSLFGEGLTGSQANTLVVRPGDLLEYKLTFINSGTAIAYDVVLEDALPSSLTIDFASDAPNGYNYFTDGTHDPAIVASSGTTAFSSAPALTNNLISMTLDEVAIGATVEVTYWLEIQDDLSVDAFFQTRSDITDYRSLPTTTVFGSEANVPRTMTSTPVAFAAIDYDYIGVVTPAPTFVREFASDITAPTPGTFLDDDTGRATIGEEITYRITIDIEDDLALYDLKLTNQNSGNNSYLQIPSGLTVRKAAYTLGGAAEVALTIPAKQGNGSTRLTLSAPIDVLDSAVTGDPEFTLLVYATLDTDDLASATGVNDNDSNNRLSLGDRLNVTPRFAWNQWNDVTSRNVENLGVRRFNVLEPGLSGLEKTLTTGNTAGLGNDFENFYGEGPDTPAAMVDSVPLFEPGDTLSYSVEFENLTTGNDGTTAYNVVLVDRIPKGLTYTAASVAEDSPTGTITETVTGPSVLDPTNMAQDVEFAFDQIGAGETVTVTYDVTVDDPVAAGRYLQNRIDITDYSTLPTGYTGVDTHTGVNEANERDSDSANPYDDLGPDYAFAGIPTPTTFSKTIETELSAPSGKITNGTSRATIGELVTYELIIDIPDGRILYDFYLYDELPDGMTVVPALMSYTLNGTPSLTVGLLNDGDREVGLALGDIEGTAAVDELILVIPATVDHFLDSSGSTALTTGDTLANGFTFSWNQVDEDPDPTVNLSTDARLTVNSVTVADVELTLEEPDLDSSLTKAQINVQEAGTIGSGEASRGTDTFYSFAAGGGPNGVNVTTHPGVEVTLPDDRIVYTIEVENTGDAPAFDVELTDILPFDDGIAYLSGTGTQTVGGGSTWTGSFTGTTGSVLTIASSSTGAGIETSTQLDFAIDFLAAGDTATIQYVVQIDRDIGAGRYLGTNEVRLVDYGSLPDSTLGVTVGNLASGSSVEDNSLERDSDSAGAGDPSPYTDQGPEELELGVEFPTFAKTVTQLYDDEGFYNPATVSASDVVRVGELLRTTLTVTLPRYTRLLDGGVSAALMRDILPTGQTYVAETVEAVVYPNYATAALDLSTFSPVFSTVESSGVQTVSLNFSDVINSTGASIIGAVEFLTEIKPLAADASDQLAVTTAQLSGFNEAHLFWNTHDTQAQRINEVASSSLTTATDDVPWLGEDGPIVLTRQPNLSLAKTASIADGSTVGATAAVGDAVTYTLTTSNAAATSFSGPAYDVVLSDVLPRNIAPLALADVTTATAGGRTLTKDEDYTFAYTYDATTRRGTIDFEIQQDTGNSDFDGRLEPGEDLVVTYDLTVNPNIGGEGSGVGLMANRANVTEFQSFPEGLNDTDRKTYDPVGPVSHTLVTPTPLVTKTSVNADASVTVGDVITYTITAPASLIRANLYQVEIRDELPEGLSFGGTGTSGPTAAGTVVLELGGASAAGNDVTVVGGSGNVTINVADDRTVSILIDLIANDEGTVATVDQVTVTLQAVVQSTFPNSAPIPRLHAFDNYAELYWFNADVADGAFTGRNRFLVLSDKVTHYFEAFGILLEPDNQGVGVPGEIKTYRHTLRNFQSTAANVPLTWSSTLGWTWVAYIGDGEGNTVSGPYEPGATFAVAGDGATEIIMQAFIPAPSTAFTTDVLTLTAFGPPDFVEALGGGDQDISVYDTTVVQSPGVVIRKDISEDDGSTYDTRLLVDPDNSDYVIQRLRFINDSPEDVKEIYVYDFVPEYTAYVAGTAVDNATYALEYSTDGGVSWTADDPGGVSDSVTNLRWYFNGGAALPPGVEHTITFKLRVK